MKPYGLMGAGPVSRSFIARLTGSAIEFGPIASTSYRVASRISNSLGMGVPVRSASELTNAEVVLVNSNPAGVPRLLEQLIASQTTWAHRVFLVCDTEIGDYGREVLRSRGAAVASLQQIGLLGMFLVFGDHDALKPARSLVGCLQGHTVVLPEDKAALFRAGMTTATGCLTPMLERAAKCFRIAGMRDSQARVLAAALFEKTSKAYGHSGKQSWAWHLREPGAAQLREEFAAVQQFADFADDFARELISALPALQGSKIFNRASRS